MIHGGTKPALTQAEKLTNVLTAKLSNHCAKCLNLNGCCFPENNMPKQPLHPNCHCTKEYIEKPVPNITGFAICSIEKIVNYAFKNDSKKHFFESNGYDIMDAGYIKSESESQAINKYINAGFRLGKLDDFGQRSTITIELNKAPTSM